MSQLSGDAATDAARIDLAVEEQALAVGRANISRAISDLVRSGFVTRHYAGYATNHENRGGGRHAVYVVPPAVLRALGKTLATQCVAASSGRRQGELFAA
jgi:predicted transcriptional regulator